MKSSEKSFLICILVAFLASYQCQALPQTQTVIKGNENNVADAPGAATEIPTLKDETTTTIITTKPSETTTTLAPQNTTTTTVAPETTNTTLPPETTTTVAPETTKTTPTPEPITTTTHAPEPNTTTIAPTTTVAPNTTTTTVAPSSTTTQAPVPPACHHFDGPSFIGGIVLTIGLLAIGLVAYKFYKARNERNYHTL